MRSERGENKASEVGMAKGHGKHEAETVKSIEHVGASGSHGIRFKMPSDKEVTDHSCVRKDLD
jgi:hypothetical protein